MNLVEAENIKKLKSSDIFFLEAIAYRTHPQTNYIKIIKRKYYWKCYKNKI